MGGLRRWCGAGCKGECCEERAALSPIYSSVALAGWWCFVGRALAVQKISPRRSGHRARARRVQLAGPSRVVRGRPFVPAPLPRAHATPAAPPNARRPIRNPTPNPLLRFRPARGTPSHAARCGKTLVRLSLRSCREPATRPAQRAPPPPICSHPPITRIKILEQLPMLAHHFFIPSPI